MLTALLFLLCIPVGLLIAWFLLLVFIDNFAPFILAMIVLFKWLFSFVVALIRYPFRPKETSSPA